VYTVVNGAASLVGVVEDWQDAVRYARRHMTAEDRGLVLKGRRWRTSPATDKQRVWLARLGLDGQTLTKGDAAALLTWGFARRALRWTQVAV
jgi:hypothetical protein